jgi:hypothetical protein
MKADPLARLGHASALAAEAQLMRELLARLQPHSGSEALRALREAFPSASLAARVAAMSQHAGEN